MQRPDQFFTRTIYRGVWRAILNSSSCSFSPWRRGDHLVVELRHECVAVATTCGYKPSEKVLSRHAAAMTGPESSLTSSMYRDLRNGAPVEADHILGDFIERGSAHGVTTPLLKAAFVNLRVYQDRLPKH